MRFSGLWGNPPVSMRRRNREEQRKETQPVVKVKGLDPIVAQLTQESIPKFGR
jgi:hypothetical protein